MQLLFSFSGTISRSQFWRGHLAVLGLYGFGDWSLRSAAWGGIAESFVVSLFAWSVACWIMLALAAKRFRDAGISPWECLFLLVPLGGVVFFLVAGTKPTKRGAA